MSLPDQKWSWKSKVIDSGGKTPEWNEDVPPVDIKTTAQKMEIVVCDEDVAGTQDVICQTTVDVAEICKAENFDQNVQLFHEGKDCGTIHITG